MRAGAGIRVVIYKSHVIESRMFKNRDKQMTYIVRVMRSCILQIDFFRYYVRFCPVLSGFVPFCPVLSRSVQFCPVLSSFDQF